MDHSVLANSRFFYGIPAGELPGILEATPHCIQHYEKGEIIFHLMESAADVGIILKGRVEAQKAFPNGSQINVSVRVPGEMIGPAAVFSESQMYPCDMVATEAVTVMMIRRDDLLLLMGKDPRVLRNLLSEIASATYMLQQRVELFSYNGIAQKAAFWLLMRERQTGTEKIRIPDSVSKWALMMNVSRSSLHRELKRMEERGALSYAPPCITILDRKALQEMLSG